MARPYRMVSKKPQHPVAYDYHVAGRCFWCGLKFNSALRKTREHLQPRAYGGTAAKNNIVAACFPCNNRRGTALNWVPFHEHRRLGETVTRETKL